MKKNILIAVIILVVIFFVGYKFFTNIKLTNNIDNNQEKIINKEVNKIETSETTDLTYNQIVNSKNDEYLGKIVSWKGCTRFWGSNAKSFS